MKCENSCVYTACIIQEETKNIFIKRSNLFRHTSNAILVTGWSKFIFTFLQVQIFRVQCRLQATEHNWIQVFWSFYFRLHKILHQQERVPDKKNIAIISAPFLWRHLFRYWHPKSRFQSYLTFFNHNLKTVLELTINGYHQ